MNRSAAPERSLWTCRSLPDWVGRNRFEDNSTPESVQQGAIADACHEGSVLKEKGSDMFKSTLAGHPLHPMLIVAPAGLLPFSFIMDLMYCRTKQTSYSDAGYHAMSGGVYSAIAAGAAGAVDYMSIPPESQTKRTANTHAILNIGVMALFGANLAMRRNRKPPTTASLIMSGVGTAGLLLSAWFGGHMVYEQGMRVKGRSEIDAAEDLKLPGDDAIKEAIDAMHI